MKTDTIILSIHPQHIKKILSGEKRYEYRKHIPMEIRYIVVYATAPIKMIVAFIEIDSIIKDTPEIVWKKTKKHAGISEDFFMSYFSNHQDAYAIKIKAAHELQAPKPLTDLKDQICAPQSYRYLKESILELYHKLGIKKRRVQRTSTK
ncbi:MAG: ASCH domain-containing protein [Alistipes senegalensis]|nr:ASCH domain-containing protein [Alistipes senegalensis]